MKIQKLLTTLVVFAVVLAAMSTVIEAQRGGGSGGGGHHWIIDAGNDNNVGDNNNAGNNAGYVEVYVSTDKRMYVLGEPIEITVRGYNPTEYAVGVDYEGCRVLTYVIDGYIGPYTRVDENGTDLGGVASGRYCPPRTYVFQPHETLTRTFIREVGTIHGDEYVPLQIGRHSVVGTVGTGDTQYESDPITITVAEIGVSVSTDKSTYMEGEPIEIEVTAYNPTDSTITLEFRVGSPDEVGCQAYYTIDAVLPFDPTFVPCNDVVDNISIPPSGLYSWPFTHTESVFPRRYSVVGVIHSVVGGVIYGQSAPATIDIVAETPVPASGPFAILLKSRQFIPEPGIDQAFEAELLASEEAAVHVLVQLYHAPTDTERRLLEENNVKQLSYIPRNAWFASIPPKNVTGIAALEEVRWVGEILPMDKIAPDLRDGIDPWEINDDGSMNLTILFFGDVSVDDAFQLLTDYGGTVLGHGLIMSGSFSVAVILPNEAVPYLAAEDSVQWIEQVMSGGGSG